MCQAIKPCALLIPKSRLHNFRFQTSPVKSLSAVLRRYLIFCVNKQSSRVQGVTRSTQMYGCVWSQPLLAVWGSFSTPEPCQELHRHQVNEQQHYSESKVLLHLFCWKVKWCFLDIISYYLKALSQEFDIVPPKRKSRPVIRSSR